jgi:DNA-binding response OmpR family regulator
LYADDNEDIVRIVRFLVKNMRGMDIETCADGEEAITAIEKDAPDLVVLDASMPHADGLTVLRWLRGRPESARVPVIFLTADHRRETREACLNAGAQKILTKPFNPSQLVAEIRNQLAAGPGATSSEKPS